MAKVEKCTCRRCSAEGYLTRDYYKSYSELNSANGKLQICKDCVSELYNKLLNKYNGDVKSTMIHLCLMLDVYFSEKLFVECSSNETFSLGEYFRRVNMEKATKNLSSLDNSVSSEGDCDKKIQIGDELIDESIIDFWGEGYDVKDYIKLERKLKKYSEHYPNKRLQEQEIIRSLCELELMRETCRLKSDINGYDKIGGQIRKAMEDLRVLPKQSGDDEEEFNVGHIAELIEFREPVPMCNDEFNDVNGIERLIIKFFVNPFKRVMGLKDKVFGDKNED